ncbi:hypothetical protein ACFSL6_23820 [Paenibacillus thailandensis]|uniref:DUF4340 domain-containing protein n=1 Tax=Paenibacillus thailandensis TaxID=393250 RepID=A0ABW5R4D3_9BACL
MKRYWSSILVVLLVAAGIATYAFAGATDHLPEYKLETVQGDPKEAEGFALSGFYGGRKYSEYMKVDTNGTWYDSRHENMREMLFGMDWLYSRSDVAELVSKHRSFMRGKKQPEHLYADEQSVIHVSEAYDNGGEGGGKKLTLELSVLDRSTGQVQQWKTETEVNLSGPYLYSFIQDVQRIGDDVHVMVTYLTRNDEQAWFDYRLGLTSGELLSANPVGLSGNDESGSPAARIESVMAPDLLTDSSEYVVLIANESSDEPKNDPVQDGQTARVDADSGEPESVEKYYSYSYRTGKTAAVPESFTKETNERDPSFMIVSGNELIRAHRGDSGVRIDRYSLEAEKQTVSLQIAAKELGGASIGQIRMEGDRAYVLVQGSSPTAAVLDTRNGELLYLGKAAYQGPAELEADEMSYLDLDNIEINGY